MCSFIASRQHVFYIITATHTRVIHTLLSLDTQPDNVLLNEQNEVKLCDFGISRMVGDRSGMTTAVGTPLLMAPELVFSDTASDSGGQAATAVDVYSFGVLLWMMAAQRLNPYEDVDNPWTLLSQVTYGRRPPLPPDTQLPPPSPSDYHRHNQHNRHEELISPTTSATTAAAVHGKGGMENSADSSSSSSQRGHQYQHLQQQHSPPPSPRSSEAYLSADSGGTSPRASNHRACSGSSNDLSGFGGGGSGGGSGGGGRNGRLSSSQHNSQQAGQAGSGGGGNAGEMASGGGGGAAVGLSSLAALKGTNLLRMPRRFRRLVTACWHPDARQRPPFKAIAKELESMQLDLRRLGPALFFEDHKDGARMASGRGAQSGGGRDESDSDEDFASGHGGPGYDN